MSTKKTIFFSFAGSWCNVFIHLLKKQVNIEVKRLKQL